MSFYKLESHHVADIIEHDGTVIDAVVVHAVEESGQRVTVQSIRLDPGRHSEFIYLPAGKVTLNGEEVFVAVPGWRMLFWESGTSTKCLNPNGPVYHIHPHQHRSFTPIVQ